MSPEDDKLQKLIEGCPKKKIICEETTRAFLGLHAP